MLWMILYHIGNRRRGAGDRDGLVQLVLSVLGSIAF